MTDAAVEILARELWLKRFETRWEYAAEQYRVGYREEATALLAQIAPLLVAEEREACAKVADDSYGEGPTGTYDNGGTIDGWNMACVRITAAIRARKG